MDGRACERCGSYDQLGPSPDQEVEAWEEKPPEQSNIPALCAEVQMAFGLIEWLCHDCRKEYFRMAKDHPLTQEYGEAQLRLEFWKARVGPTTSTDAIGKGLELWRDVDKLERLINENANKWLVSEVDVRRSK